MALFLSLFAPFLGNVLVPNLQCDQAKIRLSNKFVGAGFPKMDNLPRRIQKKHTKKKRKILENARFQCGSVKKLLFPKSDDALKILPLSSVNDHHNNETKVCN